MTSILICEYVFQFPQSPHLPRPCPLICWCFSYYIVRRRNVSVPDMYDFQGMYRYSQKFGSNWRAVVAFFIGCVPPLPGFVNNIQVAGGGHTSVSKGGQHL